MALIRIDVHHWLHNDREEAGHGGLFSQILHLLTAIKAQGAKVDQDVQNLIDKVAEVKGETASTKAFIAGLEQRLNDILVNENLKPETTAALKAMFSDLSASSQELKDAIDNDPSTPAQPAA